MPSKGKRVAARQNNLRRRRNNANRSNPPSGARATAVAEPAPANSPSTSSAAPAAAPVGASRAIGRPETQPRGRRFDRPVAYNHVGSELTRIGIFSGVLVVALVAVSFVL